MLTAFGFGLIHGLGFAGGLNDLGLTGRSLVQSLVSFNIGIEFGQLLILAPSMFILAGLAKLGSERRDGFATAASICLGMTGCFWLAERLF